MTKHVSGRDPAATALMVVGSLLLLLVLVFLVSRLAGFIASQRTPPPTVAVATSAPAEAPGNNTSAGEPTALRGGKQIVETVCMACHGSGVLGAPGIDDHAQWLTRVGQGFDVLLRHTVEGFKNMPPRGGDPALSDAELKLAIAYMLDRAGIEAPKSWERAGSPSPGRTQ